MTRRAPRGFANPEIPLLVAAALIVAAIAIPRIYKSMEPGRNRKAVAELRDAIKRYAADHNGMNPVYLQDLTTGGKYLKEIPRVGIMGVHAPSAEVKADETADDAGGWVYNNWPGSPRGGEAWINCTHTDARGSAWSAY